MNLIADGLLIATALAASIYCAVLGRRLRRLASTEDGIGGQIAALNGAVEETRTALESVQERIEALRSQSGNASDRVRREIDEAERLSGSLETASAEARRFLDQLYSVLDSPSGDSPNAQTKERKTEVQKDEADPEEEDFEVVGGQVAKEAAPTADDAAPAPRTAPAGGEGASSEVNGVEHAETGALEGAMEAAPPEPPGDDEAWASPAEGLGGDAAQPPTAKGLLKVKRMGF